MTDICFPSFSYARHKSTLKCIWERLYQFILLLRCIMRHVTYFLGFIDISWEGHQNLTSWSGPSQNVRTLTHFVHKSKYIPRHLYTVEVLRGQRNKLFTLFLIQIFVLINEMTSIIIYCRTNVVLILNKKKCAGEAPSWIFKYNVAPKSIW